MKDSDFIEENAALVARNVELTKRVEEFELAAEAVLAPWWGTSSTDRNRFILLHHAMTDLEAVLGKEITHPDSVRAKEEMQA